MELTTVLLAVIGVILALALVIVIGRGRGPGDATVFQQQLIELRSRLDALAEAQRQVPGVLARGSAEQAKGMADLREQLAALMEATRRMDVIGRSVEELQGLLRVPKLRGTLGEVWLEELLRQVFPDAFYQTQYAFRSGATVDAVLRVGERWVPIDSKFPLEACQRMLVADSRQAERERREFRRTLRARIDEIAESYIRPDEGTYDFAFMYIPAEGVYYEAVVRGDDATEGQSVVAYALERRVIPVSPNTFYAYLAVILHGLRGLEVQERASQILDSIGGLQQQFLRFERAYGLLGKHLDNAEKQYAESIRLMAGIRTRFRGIGGLQAKGERPPLDIGQPDGELESQ